MPSLSPILFGGGCGMAAFTPAVGEGQNVAAFRERGPVMVTRPAIEPNPQVYRRRSFHSIPKSSSRHAPPLGHGLLQPKEEQAIENGTYNDEHEHYGENLRHVVEFPAHH